MKFYLVILTAAAIICLTGCSSKDQVYEGVYEGLKMGKDFEQDRQDPSGDRITTDDEKLPDYDRYKKDREDTLNKNRKY